MSFPVASGMFTSAGLAYELELGWAPTYFAIYNRTKWATNDSTLKAEYFRGMAPNSALLTTRGTTTLSTTLEASNGFSLLDNIGGVIPIVSITQANPAVVTTATAIPFTTGDRVTVTGVAGMTQINNGNYTVRKLSNTSFQLSVDSSGFGAYTSGGTVMSINGVTVGTKITNITQANPGAVTAIGHGLVTGDQVLITQVQGMTQVNNQTFTVTRTNANVFTIGVDTSAYTAYARGGIVQKVGAPVSNTAKIGILIGSACVGADNDIMQWYAYGDTNFADLGDLANI